MFVTVVYIHSEGQKNLLLSGCTVCTHTFKYAVYVHSWKSCWELFGVSVSRLLMPPCCLGDERMEKKQEDEKQKKMGEEDFDLIVQHYLGVYIFLAHVW